MESWREPRSLFAPLIIGADLSALSAPGFGNALLAAAGSVPETTVPYTVKKPGKLKREAETRVRTLACITGDAAGPYAARVRLVDVPPRMTAAAAPLACRRWEAGLYVLKKGTATPAIPDDLDLAVLEISMYRLSGEGFTGAGQLALLRHLWILSLSAADPGLLVIGGQDGWSDDWWRVPAAVVGNGKGST